MFPFYEIPQPPIPWGQIVPLFLGEEGGSSLIRKVLGVKKLF